MKPNNELIKKKSLCRLLSVISLYPNVDYLFDPVVIAEEFFWVSSIGGSFTADILSISVFRKKINIKLHHLNEELENANKTKIRFFVTSRKQQLR